MRLLRKSEIEQLTAIFNTILDSTRQTAPASPEDVEMKLAIRLAIGEAADVLAGRPVQKVFAEPPSR